ncbi:MAG: hypothetical protein IJV37_06590 [Bacteroidales bacterium]|nr:hypothetical protein [Bacteroidales bacterium]
MKALRLITFILLTLTNMTLPACAKDDQDHTLTRLWASYRKAVDADKPKDQADILAQIKQEAAARHRAWDYYDACWKYVDARTSTNWKLRDELRAEAYNDIMKFGEPVAVYFTRKGEGNTSDGLRQYILSQKDAMLQAHNPEFYGQDGHITGLLYGEALVPLLQNDYEYALWSLFGRFIDSDTETLIREHFSGRYPFDAFIEYSTIRRKAADIDARMAEYVDSHAGQAVSMLGRQHLLQRRQDKLRWNDGTSGQYRQLALDCEAFIADRKKFSGSEKAIAGCCDAADGILAELTSQEISLDATLGHATLTVRNLPSVRLRILDGKKEVWDHTVQNPDGKFYLKDTLEVDLPALDDKTYTLKCSGGKTTTESEYRKYTLSIAHKRDLDGYGVYVADFITGEPVKRCDILLYDSDGKQADKAGGLVIDGFTYLPESLTARLEKDHWGWTIQAETVIDGRIRRSQKHSFDYNRLRTVGTDNPATHHAMLLTDRSAFNPDETVHYKVLLYEGTYEYAVRPQGISLKATLTDPSGKQIDEQTLTTNEFGTAAGSFVLRKGERGGMYTISVFEGDKKIADTEVRADEFILPTFELTWKSDNRFWLPGDDALAEGTVRSYSGHNLASATATYRVEYQGNVISDGELPLSPAGDFKIRFRTLEDQSWYSNYVVTVRVTDATGETLEFRKGISVSPHLPLSIRILNRADGRFEQPNRYNGGSIVGEDIVRARIQLGIGQAQTHPGLKIEYTLLRDGKPVLSGLAANGEELSLDLTGRPTGLYTLEATASSKSDSGKDYSDTERHDIVKASDSDKALDLDARCFFKELPDDGTGIALQVGTTTGPAWIVAELYGDGNRLLDKRLVRLEGVRGKAGSLEVIRFARQGSYPETLTLKVFWFRDGRSFEYEVSSYKPKSIAQLPLSFSRFLDTTAPHLDYDFTIRTAAGAEVAATIFDKSTETIERNVWTTDSPRLRSLPDVRYSSTTGTDSSYAFQHELAAASGKALFRSKAAAGNAAMPEMMMAEDSATMDAAEEAAPDGSEMEENTAIRENFANTIAWEPFLRSDSDGVVTFHFTTADKLSTYYVQLFAHDKAFHNTTLRREMVVTLPVKVAVVQPQFLYEGDRYSARVTVANSKGTPVSGRLSVRFLDGRDYKTAPEIGGRSQHVTVPAGGSFDFVCEIAAPKVRQLGMLVNFTADNKEFGSDGVFVVMPVSPAVQQITEAHSALLLAGMERDAVLASLRSQFVNVQGAEAALREISILGMIQEAIPEKVLPRSENVLDQSESLFANYLIDRLPGSKGSAATAEQRADMVDKILASRTRDGGYGWFPGMSASPLLTAVLLERFAAMGDACPQELAATLPDAVKFLDGEYFGDGKRPFWCGGLSLAQYLHVRALFPEVSFAPKAGLKAMREFKKEVRDYLVPGKVRGLNGQVFAKARRMKTLRALLGDDRGAALARALGISLFAKGRLRRSLDKDIASLLQYAEPHRSGGTYYPNAVMPWRGLLESELYAHALICDLLTDCGHHEVAEGIRLWIMVQKETQQWADDPAYIQAIGSVLHGTEATLQTKVLALSATTTLPFAQIKAAGNGFTVSRTFTRDGQVLREGDVLHVGDKIIASYHIWNEENRSFVRLTAPRPAAFRPVEQRSGRYGWFGRPISITGWVSFSPQGYRSVLADRTEYWFDSYPEEKTTLTEEYFVTQEGSFQCPVPVIESLYAPHYRANGDGTVPVTVGPKLSP